MAEQGKLANLYEQLKHGDIDRRGFLKGATALGVATPVSMFLVNTAAGASRNGYAQYALQDATPAAAPEGFPDAGMEGKTRGQDGNLSLLQWQAPTHLMAHRATGTKDFMAADMVNEPLMRYAADATLRANLVTEVPSVENGLLAEDLSSVTFNLLEGVVWSDGEPFTANDVVFTWQWIMELDNASVSYDIWSAIENIEAVDDLTVHVTFASPSAAWFDAFTGGNNGHIMPAHLWGGEIVNEEVSAAFQLAPIGTGPYKVVEFEPNDGGSYEINELYRFENKPAFATIELKGGGDAAAAARSVLQTGDFDYAWNLQVEPEVLASMVEDDNPGELKVEPGTSLERIHFNFTDPNTEVDGQRSEMNTPHPWLTDPDVREAMNLAIDRELIATSLYSPGEPATANVLVGIPAFDSPNTSWAYDPAQANQILDDAGWALNDDGVREKDGVQLSGVFATSVNLVRQKTQSIVQQNFSAIGVEVTLEQVDAGIYFDSAPGNDQTINKMYWDMNMYTNNSTSTIPIAYMSDWYAGPDRRNFSQASNDWTGGNRQRWANEEYDAAFEAVQQVTTMEEAAELFITMNDLIINDRAVVPLVNRAADVYAISKSLYNENVALGAGFEYNYWNIANWNRREESE